MAKVEHKVVSKQEWLAARKDFLAKEKEFTRLRDELTQERRNLPWVKVEKEYIFDGPNGKETLADLFEGRSQLIIYHFMFGPGWGAGCPHCSHWADNFNGVIVHLNHRDVTFIAVSHASFSELAAYKKRMGWNFKWMSSHDSDFNYDYHVSFTPDQMEKKETVYNFNTQQPPASEMHGVSVFYKDPSGDIFHTYSTYGRGIDMMNVDYQYLDITPKGRDENGRGPFWVRRHDEYND
ncbi:thioredoxin family protein [bacterium]|nr:thioredoxin family protein [bacterium]